MLDAENAREVTKNSLKPNTTTIRPYLDNIGDKIKVAASEGKNEINHPFRYYKGSLPYPSAAIQEAVRKAVEHLGYTWIDHLDPDPGDPRGGSYTTISW